MSPPTVSKEYTTLPYYFPVCKHFCECLIGDDLIKDCVGFKNYTNTLWHVGFTYTQIYQYFIKILVGRCLCMQGLKGKLLHYTIFALLLSAFLFVVCRVCVLRIGLTALVAVFTNALLHLTFTVCFI